LGAGDGERQGDGLAAGAAGAGRQRSEVRRSVVGADGMPWPVVPAATDPVTHGAPFSADQCSDAPGATQPARVRASAGGSTLKKHVVQAIGDKTMTLRKICAVSAAASIAMMVAALPGMAQNAPQAPTSSSPVVRPAAPPTFFHAIAPAAVPGQPKLAPSQNCAPGAQPPCNGTPDCGAQGGACATAAPKSN
jgi:hypothetical protein